MNITDEQNTSFLLYQTPDGQTRLEVRLQDETVWLSLTDMSDLFQRDKSVISRHIRNIFAEGELVRDSVIANFATTAADGKTYQVEHFNLDVIISVGYRVKSHRGTQFRIWATQRLREYLVKGFTLDDERLKRGGGGNYFDELLARIRDIRSAERVFWRKVLDIYATSIDYDPKTEVSQQFFASVQNKMHWAAHGHTAAEIIHTRADANQPNMGMTHWIGTKPGKAEITIAKNYLTPDELNVLNRIVTAYLELAELQALNRTPMYMQDWATRLDDFLRMTGRELLDNAGTISHQQALQKAEQEYAKYRQALLSEPQPIDRDFEQAIEKLPKPRK
ncbi:MAG: virulence RhuM family protein [Thiothrix sp.]|uniref:virulence RhuM family protein n=1 Tax=Thiothrix sp. TaxID=1032 RepID=UPI0026195AE9|nr:virulence RhuM family protein [Thiothrix sp.]MDD5391756.1 virulence RhuM family protein [Thiothrix sp.]